MTLSIIDKKVLKWNFVFQYGYVITNIIGGLILLPFYLKWIDKDTLGVWLGVNSILSLMTLIDPGIGEILQQKIAELRGRGLKDEISKTIGSGFIACGFILVLAIIAGVVFYSLIGTIIDKDVTKYPHLQIALFIAILSTGLSLVSFGVSGINQGLHNVTQVAISAILANILFLFANIILLLLGYGIISIAFANLCRGLFINVYNFIAVKYALRHEGLIFIFQWHHFKGFIRVFSFTSMSNIIGGLSASMDTIFLARFISPAMITILEVNKRPLQQAQALVGRHSVALMPLISYAVGKGDSHGILTLINSQFKYYSYAALFVVFEFYFNYYNLIGAWTGTSKYAGDTIIYLLICNLFFALIGYFMSNMCYALGDIKMTSLINILKGSIIGSMYYFSAKYYGIVGVLSIMLIGNICIDFSLFSLRLYKLGYFKTRLIKNILSLWIIIVPIIFLVGSGCKQLFNAVIVQNSYFIKLLLNGGILALCFVLTVLTVDKVLRADVLKIVKRKPKVI
ncbi:lipopolysaccharide biosynthesis protein [Mucilaginibacter sp. UYCu711]|uniref:lipopolysaccharide biosynthesis protein n=1 Tax=Mucilaginibacter sp. UYCu711 TaxID=3156339 RepID=UPI003D1A2227